MSRIEFSIERQLGVISEKSKGWNKELNYVSWNGRDPKYDIREWDPDHETMGKGVTFTQEELSNLYEILKTIFDDIPGVPNVENSAEIGSLSINDIVRRAE